MFTTLVGLSLVALVAGPAAAQGQGRGFGRGGSLAGLLGNESVQKELKLDDAQTTKAKETSEKIGAEAREKFTALGQDLSQEERREKMMAITHEINEATLKAVGEYLKPEQITRLKQISYQQRGASALTDPEVAKKLNISDSQKTEIQSVVQESFGKMNTIRTEHEGDREGMMKAMTELRKETLAKAEAKLNDEQQKTWKELIGSPFEVKYEPRPQ
jgi:hypothetical protein